MNVHFRKRNVLKTLQRIGNGFGIRYLKSDSYRGRKRHERRGRWGGGHNADLEFEKARWGEKGWKGILLKSIEGKWDRDYLYFYIKR